MANVYRRGTKSVHIGTRRQLGLDVETIPECAFDAGGSWGPVRPPGPRCEACFGAGGTGRRSRGSRAPLVAATTAGFLAAAVVLASVDEPVNYFPTAAPSATFSASPVLVTPGPSLDPLPTRAPVLTPRPTIEPDPTREPQPTYPPIPTYPPLPTFGPLPTFKLPDVPLPTIKVCLHPGSHIGVKDICTWPGNR